MIEKTILISPQKKFDKQFSICTIVNNKEEYRLMKESFVGNGFVTDCEYMIADNSEQNNFDAYSAIRRFLQEANGEYIVIVHQDVRCMDNKGKLTNSLQALEKKDPSWAICGNAGANGYKHFIINMDNNGVAKRTEGLPAPVTSLDENFLIIKSKAQLSLSADLNSFHFYGTDLCIIADILGFTSYVIDFLVAHLSSGNLKDMDANTPIFLRAYGRKLRQRFIQTTCTKFFLSDSDKSNKAYNKPFVFFWIKAANRFSSLFNNK